MNGTTRFGDFLLLKKLSEDPLGETYRAGRVEGNKVGEILFLRTFSVPGARTAELADALHEFESSQRVQAPGLTYPVGGGEVGGVAYVVYDYSTSWDVLQVLAAAQAAFAEVERDHALLLAERIAKGLTVLHQIDAPGARPCHGFLVPHNVRVTGEGEIELIGLEVGPYLARLAAAGDLGDTRAYLSPQVLAGAAPTAADDVYSLGAILWRLLLGAPPPADAAAHASTLGGARMGDGQPVPTGLAELLRSSLAEPSARPAHAGFWHHQLTDWMAFEQIRTTHFDLAFFIHELFRRQIQAEKDEIVSEKRLDLAPRAAEPTPAEPAASAPADVVPRPDLSGSVRRPRAAAPPAAAPALDTAVRPPPRGSPLYGAAALAAVAVALAGVGWWLLRPGATPEPPPVQAAPPPPPPPASSELQMAQEELERLVRERTQAVGDQIASEYDEHIRSLREQLEEARSAEAEALRSAARPAAVRPAATRVVETPSAGAPSPSITTPPVAPPQAAGPTAPPPSAPPPSAPPPSVPPPAVAETTDAEPMRSQALPPPSPEPSPPPAEPAEPAAEDVASSPLDTVPAPPPSLPASTPAEPNVTPPDRLSMPKPVFPTRARQHRKEATVLIKVLVDVDGKVIDAQPVIDKPDPYGFLEAAVQAARQAQFRPARSDGAPIRMWTTVVISFKL